MDFLKFFEKKKRKKDTVELLNPTEDHPDSNPHGFPIST